MTWLVRLGTVRGKGRYVDCFTSYNTGFGSCRSQRGARRFDRRDIAEGYASAAGGRVVRLRRKKR